MPPAAIGATFVALGASAATGAAVTAIATAVYVGAAYGAVAGAVTAVFTGEDVIDAAVKGAVIGGVSGGIMKGVGMFTGAESAAAADAGIGKTNIAQAGLEEAVPGPGIEPGTFGGEKAIKAAQAAQAQAAVQQPVSNFKPIAAAPPQQQPGILARAGNWIEKNPTQAMLLGQTIGGVASGISSARAKEKEIEALMERDRLNIESQKVKDLNKMNLKIALPTVSGFTGRRPDWQAPRNWQSPKSGILYGGMNNATA